MHERVKRTTSGVRQRPHQQGCNTAAGVLPPLLASSTSMGASLRSHAGTKLFDALAHPTAAAAAVHGPPRRGRKRKAASWIVLTAACLGVVYYSSTMYEYDTELVVISGAGASTTTKQTRRTRLRSRNRPKMTTVVVHNAAPNEDNRAGFSLAKAPSQPLQRLNGSTNDLSPYDRMYHAMTSAFIADAASMGTHWIYNPTELRQQLLEDGGMSGEQALERPEFLPQPPFPRFYSAQEFPGHYGRGQASPYGEQLLFVSEYTASTIATTTSSTNRQEPDDVTAAEHWSAAFYNWATTFGGRLDTATQAFLACRRDQADAGRQAMTPANAAGDDDGSAAASPVEPQYCGAPDDQAHYFLKIIPVTCLYAGRANRRSKVEQAIRVHQNRDSAVVYGLALSDLLEAILFLGGEANDDDAAAVVPVNSLNEALDQVWQSIQRDQAEYIQRNADIHAWLPQLVGVGAKYEDLPYDNTPVFQAWKQAKELAEQLPALSLEQVASSVGRSCHMPGALIVSLFAVYRTAALVESSSTQTTIAASLSPQNKSPTTFLWRSYEYFVQTLWGESRDDSNALSSLANNDNPYLVQAIRDNILASGDTCSRAILIAALLGAAFGGFPTAWSDRIEPELWANVQAAARKIAQSATAPSLAASRTPLEA